MLVLGRDELSLCKSSRILTYIYIGRYVSKEGYRLGLQGLPMAGPSGRTKMRQECV